MSRLKDPKFYMEDDWKAVVENIDKDGNLMPIQKKKDQNIHDLRIAISEKRSLAMKKSLGALFLFLTILGGSSIGTFANFIPVKTSLAKNAWRAGLNITFFIIPTIIEFFLNRGKVNYRSFFTLKNYMYILITLIFQSLWTFGLIYASLNTIQSHAYIFSNVNGLILVGINYIRRVKLHKLEIIGSFISVVGCIVMAYDPEASRSDGVQGSIFIDMIAFLSAIAGAIYFMASS